MITAKRMAAIELEDGTLEVVIHVHPESKAAFFGAAPNPGGAIFIVEKEKPPTQMAAPSGAEPPPPPMASYGAMEVVRGLIKSPIFQAYVEEVVPSIAASEKDAEAAAARYLNLKTSEGGGMSPAEFLPRLRSDFSAWCKARGYPDA